MNTLYYQHYNVNDCLRHTMDNDSYQVYSAGVVQWSMQSRTCFAVLQGGPGRTGTPAMGTCPR